MTDTLADVALDGSEEFQIEGFTAWWYVVSSKNIERHTLTIRSDDMFLEARKKEA